VRNRRCEYCEQHRLRPDVVEAAIQDDGSADDERHTEQKAQAPPAKAAKGHRDDCVRSRG